VDSVTAGADTGAGTGPDGMGATGAGAGVEAGTSG